jgi:PAS domain S-box-containing protein
MTHPPLELSTEYCRFRRRLLAGFLTVACLTIATIGWRIHSSYVERENVATLQIQTLAHTIAAHLTDAIELADYAVAGFAKDFKELPQKKIDSAAAIAEVLSSRAPAINKDFSMLFIDAGGVGVASSNHAAIEGVSYAERDYYRTLGGVRADPGLFIGEPVQAKASARRVFTLSRRVLDGQGRFTGIVVGMMDAARLAAILENARFNKDISISLVHRGGKIISRVPLFEQTFSTSLQDSPMFTHMGVAPPRNFRAKSPIDGQDRIYSFYAIDKRPLDVIAGISVQALNRSLRDDLLLGAGRALVLIAIMLVSTYLVLGSYRRLGQAKQALQESEFRWRFALEGAGDSVWDWNIETDQVDFSPRWKQMMGYAANEFGNSSGAWSKHVHPKDKTHAIAERQALVAGRIPVLVSEYRMRCKDGSWRWILSRGIVMSRDGAGRALRAIGTHADITDRKQAEQAQVQRVVEAAPDPMLLVASDGAIIFANGAAHTTFGYYLTDLAGTDINQLVPFKSADAHAGGLPFGKRLESARHRDGAEFPVEMSLSPLNMNGQEVIIASIHDLSDSWQSAEMLQQSFTQLRQLSDHQEQIKESERKRIAQDIHDDLGQNLLALKMDVTVLHARTVDSHPRLNQRVGIVLNNISATILSVRSIMNDLRPAVLDLGLHAAATWHLQQFERMSGIACVLASAAPQAEFGLNESQTLAVFRILQESLANVARHAQASEVRIALTDYPHGFSMTVSDNGKGLQPGDRSKGNSFGLMGIRERTHSLGGALSITSSPGSGTVLSISIPFVSIGLEA